MEFTSLLFLKTKEKGNELLHLGPWISVSSHGRSLAELDRTGEVRAAVFRQGEAPAVRGKLGKRVRGLVHTCRWSQLGLRWPAAACPGAPAAGGGPVSWLRRSGEGERARSGRGASGGGRGAIPGLILGEGRPEG